MKTAAKARSAAKARDPLSNCTAAAAPESAAAAASPTTGTNPCKALLPVLRAAESTVPASTFCTPNTNVNNVPQSLKILRRHWENSEAASSMPVFPQIQAQDAKQKYICIIGNSIVLIIPAKKPDIAKNMPLYTNAPVVCPPTAATPLNTGTKEIK